MAYDNSMSGALFRNEKKTTESHPDYKGSCEVDGVEYWISSWINISKAGQKYMSLKFQPKEDVAEATKTFDADDSIPF